MPNSSSPIANLRRFARARAPSERCELCGMRLPAAHQHLLELAKRRLVCSCDACAILFDSGEAVRFRRVPRRIEMLADFRMTDAQWEGLRLPINLAFIYSASHADRVVAMYPSPAGATESLLALESWSELAADNPVLNQLQPDVEALLIQRIGESREYFRVPIDECFKLVGIIRAHWRGLSGGAAVWGQIHQFFDDLKQRSASKGAHYA